MMAKPNPKAKMKRVWIDSQTEEEIRRGFALTFQELQMMSNQTIRFLHNI